MRPFLQEAAQVRTAQPGSFVFTFHAREAHLAENDSHSSSGINKEYCMVCASIQVKIQRASCWGRLWLLTYLLNPNLSTEMPLASRHVHM